MPASPDLLRIIVIGGGPGGYVGARNFDSASTGPNVYGMQFNTAQGAFLGVVAGGYERGHGRWPDAVFTHCLVSLSAPVSVHGVAVCRRPGGGCAR